MNFEGFTPILNPDINTAVLEELRAFPPTGETNVIAGLRQCDVYIQGWRVREAMLEWTPSTVPTDGVRELNVALTVYAILTSCGALTAT